MPPKKAPAPVALAPKVPTAGPFTVAGQTMYFALPERMSIRAAIANAFGESDDDPASRQLVLSAAIGLSCEALQAKEGFPPYAHRVLDFGAAMLDWLLEAGAAKGDDYLTTAKEIRDAGNGALRLVVQAVVRTEDLEEARGNSSTAAGGSTSSSA